MTLDEFFAIVDSIEPNTNGCKIWTGGTTGGYGCVRIDKRGGQELTHRLSLERKLGRPIGAGLYCCHTCDVRGCCNPDHLWEGSPADNAADMVKKGRSARQFGPANGMYGVVPSKEVREKISKALSGPNHPKYGIHEPVCMAGKTEAEQLEINKKISESMSGPNNHRFGVSPTKTTRDKISESMRRYHEEKRAGLR